MNIEEFFNLNPNVAIAFSGGVDSAYLLYEATKYAKKVKAYYVKSSFQPQFELDDAIYLCDGLKADMKVINVDVLSDDKIISNPSNRCYYCKRRIFEAIKKAAREDGFDVILDGTNASDEVSDRPGMKALEELKVLSPLRMCDLTKDDIRKKSLEANLFTWNKAAYACLATRIPTGTKINEEILKATEIAEGKLFDMGFTDFRIRYFDKSARIQVKEDQLKMLINRREDILNCLKPYYDNVFLDLEVR